MINLVIIGAGEAGKMVLNEIIHKKNLSIKYNILGFLDDNKSGFIENIPVIGKIDDSPFIIEKYNVQEIIIAIPSATKEVINRILNLITKFKINIKIVPGIFEIIQGNVSFSQIREIDPVDLLGREEVGFDFDKIQDFYKDKTIFVSGAGGSIGSEIFLQLMNLPIKKAIALGHGENSIHSLIMKLQNDKRFDFVIGDIKDKEKINFELNRFKPDIFFHAAAHKHVPLMEIYPDEAIKNNILGTYNCAYNSIKNNVKNFILISTDKAVNPTSIMGATKRVAEKIILSLNKIQNKTKFSLTRFGNVLGSRGSVIPIFKEQIEKGGPITVTDPEVTRYFMSIREAARLVIKSLTIKEGNIFVLDMGQQIKIIDLAKNMLKIYGYSENEIPIVITGLRKGEKKYEELLNSKENLTKTIFDKLFISSETEKFFNKKELLKLIKDFKEVANTFDKSKIINLIKNYVPEYQGVNENNE